MGGYPLVWRQKVLEAARKGYCRIWNLEINNQGSVNRHESHSATTRRAARLCGSSTWFKSNMKANSPEPVRNTHKPAKNRRPAKTKIESILFVPYTPYSNLKKAMQNCEDSTSSHRSVCRVRVIERAGPTVGDILTQKHPWKKESCQRADCHPCKSKPGGCRAANVTYKIKCQTCQVEKGKKVHYYGESHRVLYDRAKDHFQALEKKDSTYAVVKHWQESHGDMVRPPSYSIQLVSAHKSSLERQIKEAILIELESPDVELINGKSEWGQNRVPRVRNTMPEHLRHPKYEEKKNPFNKRPKDEHDPSDDQLPVGPPSHDPHPDPECFQGQYKQRKRARIAAKRNGHMRMFANSDAPQE